jgi:hypothetical protein
MSSKTPLQQVNDQHGGKEKLVDKLLGLVERGEEPKDELRVRLLTASNTKLLRLFAVTNEVKERFGDKEKLVEAILGFMNRVKDVDYREKLLSLSPSRLVDLYRTWHKKARPSA